MKQNMIVLSLFALIAAALVVVPKVSADMCTTQYGGTTTCVPSDLTINKQVYDPETKKFVENLTTTDQTFSAGQEVVYKLTVKNGSGETFQAEVKDFLPPYLTFVAANAAVDYTVDSRTLKIKLENLIAGETRSFDIRAKVVDKSRFPAGKSLFCVVNVAEVRALNRFDTDSAQVCLGESVLGVTTLPVAGFNDFMVLLPAAGVALGGIALLKGKKG